MKLKKIIIAIIVLIFMIYPPLSQAKTVKAQVAKGVMKNTLLKKSIKKKSKKAKKRYTKKNKSSFTVSDIASRHYIGTGSASYYSSKFEGRRTASGEIFNQNDYTAAHKTIAFGSYVQVTNLKNGRKVVVRINDRGPFSQTRIIDVSKAAAKELGMIQSGVATVHIEKLNMAKASEKLLKEHTDLINNSVYTLKMVNIRTQKEANQLARAVKSKAEVISRGNTYDLVIHAMSKEESQHDKLQLERLSRYPIFSYSQK